MFGQNIKDLREDNDLTQRQLAQIIGVNAKTITRYEKEYQDITSEKLVKLCRYFKGRAGLAKSRARALCNCSSADLLRRFALITIAQRAGISLPSAWQLH